MKIKLSDNYPQTEKVLKKFRAYMLQQSKSNLAKRRLHSSGDLKKSIKGIIYKTQARNTLGQFTGKRELPSIQFSMNAYGDFVDQGVKGSVPSKSIEKKSPYKFRNKKKSVPTSRIKAWLMRKGRYKKGDEYAIARSIYIRGLKRSLFWTTPWKKRYPSFTREYNYAAANDMARNTADRLEKIIKQKLTVRQR